MLIRGGYASRKCNVRTFAALARTHCRKMLSKRSWKTRRGTPLAPLTISLNISFRFFIFFHRFQSNVNVNSKDEIFESSKVSRIKLDSKFPKEKSKELDYWSNLLFLLKFSLNRSIKIRRILNKFTRNIVKRIIACAFKFPSKSNGSKESRLSRF